MAGDFLYTLPEGLTVPRVLFHPIISHPQPAWCPQTQRILKTDSDRASQLLADAIWAILTFIATRHAVSILAVVANPPLSPRHPTRHFRRHSRRTLHRHRCAATTAAPRWGGADILCRQT